MHSLRGWKWLVFGGVVGSVSAVLSAPAITPAPRPVEVDLRLSEKRQDDNALSLAQVLLTALPLSLRLIAATNIPAVSSILWSEFLDGKKPQWFLNLPSDLQSYLITEFGPRTAWPTAPPTSSGWDGEASATSTWPPSKTPTQSSNSALKNTTPSSGSLSTIITGSTPVASSTSKPSATPSTSPATTASLLGTFNTPSSPTSSVTKDPVVPAFSNSGLTRRQKIGIGIGVPIALFAVAAILLGCCFLLRRRRRRHNERSEPPSSPGFIPRFSFQDRSLSSEHLEHRAPLNFSFDYPSQDANTMNWDDDEYDPAEFNPPHRAYAPSPATAPIVMQESNPLAVPDLYHTHSSTRARGKRTSYKSLRSVAEVTEPDEEMTAAPVPDRHEPPKQSLRRLSAPLHIEMPPIPAAATMKRNTVPTGPTGTTPAAGTTPRSFSRPRLTKSMPEHTGSSSSGLAVSSTSTASGLGYHTDASSPTSPAPNHAPKNPFAGGYDYLEDYGPEYSNDTYLDLEDGLYGGNRSLDRYPGPSPPKMSSKTEWPLRSVMGSIHRRNKSPLWDRVYER